MARHKTFYTIFVVSTCVCVHHAANEDLAHCISLKMPSCSLYFSFYSICSLIRPSLVIVMTVIIKFFDYFLDRSINIWFYYITFQQKWIESSGEHISTWKLREIEYPHPQYILFSLRFRISSFFLFVHMRKSQSIAQRWYIRVRRIRYICLQDFAVSSSSSSFGLFYLRSCSLTLFYAAYMLKPISLNAPESVRST